MSMMSNISLGRYYPTKSVVHQLDPRLKILLVVAYMTIVFILNKPLPMALCVIGLLVLIFLSNVPIRQVVMSLKPILFILAFAFILNLLTIKGKVLLSLGPVSITEEGLIIAVRMALRLILLITGTTLLLTLTTTPILIADAMERLLSPLARFGFPAHEMAMMMSIALRFVPTLLEETDKIMKAQSSRGADYDTGGLITKAKGLVSVLIPLFVSAFKRAEELAVAMEARCYRGGAGRTRLKIMRFTRKDGWFAVSFGLITMALLILQFVQLA
jgi:energy-coupling factor transport system permease protein